MTVSPVELSSGHGFICSCPICTGQGLEAIPLATEVASGLAESNPISSLPALNSNPGAAAKLFLDFNGHLESSWGGRSNVSTPVFDRDGNFATFTDGELGAIYEIWARVAEDFAPFNINVTTVDPGHQANQVVAVIAIGGNWSDWYGSSAGGVAYIGGFYNSASNVGYVFDDALGNGNAKYVAEAASHEAGHLFGLLHQATWNGSTLSESYSTGSGGWAPLMGVGYYEPRTTWHNGATSNGPSAFQDDMAILTNASNGFGYRTDDVGDFLGSASVLPVSGTSVNVSGLIGRANDVDMWSFTTSGGAVSLVLAGAEFSPNLDAVLELRDSNGSVLVSSAPTNSLGASISITVGPGTYFLVARGMGDYGDVGRYAITGTLPAAAPAPEISLSLGGYALASGGTLNFGSTTPSATVLRTVTVTNQGTDTLTLTPLDGGALPSGFTLVQNLAATSLSPGESTTFIVEFDATAYGSYAGQLTLASNDADESTFSLQLAGTIGTPAPAATILDDGNAGNTLAGTWKVKSGIGYGNDMRQAAKGTGSSSATWNFTGLAAGQYQVWVTYRIASTNATNAPFTLLNGNSTLRTVRVNQRVTPASLQADGARWQSLGNVWINSGRLVVRLTNAANGQVVADAVRIERVATGGGLAAALTTSTQATPGSFTSADAPARLATGQMNSPASNFSQFSPAASSSADDAAETQLWRNVIDLLRSTRQALADESAIDQLAADELAWSELLAPLA